MKKNGRPNALWRLEHVGGRSQLFRVIAPLAVQKSREKTMCVAICAGDKRLAEAIQILNDLQVKV